MQKLLIILAALLGMGADAARAADDPTPADSGIGVNIDMLRYWESDWPFINELKRAPVWTTNCDQRSPQCRDFPKGASQNGTKEEDKLELDEHGWIKRLPNGDDPNVKFRSVSTLLFQGNGGAHAAGRYVVLYDGVGTIEYNGAGRKIAAESRPGRDVLDMSNKPGVGLQIRIRAVDASDHLRNIRIIGPGGVCTGDPQGFVPDASQCRSPGTFRSLEELSRTQVVHPAFSADLHGFRVLRFWNDDVLKDLNAVCDTIIAYVRDESLQPWR